MPIDKKAERFVNRLAHKLNSDEYASMGEAKFRAMFQAAVDDLPDNKRLKDFLVDNFDTYFNKLWRNVQGITSAHDAVPGSIERRYNLRAADGLRSALSWVGTLPQAEQMPHYLNLFQRWFPSAEGSDALLDNIISSKKDDLDCLVTLTQLLNLNKQAVALQKVAAAFFRRLEQAYANCLQGDTQERAAELREIVLRFLTVLNIQRDPAVKWENTAYEDLVAAFVSLYVDLSLLVTRTQLGTESVVNVSQSIGNCILVWLGHSPAHILDVLVQLEADSGRDGAILTPIYRRFLHTAPSPLTHQSYIRYMCAVCKAREVIPKNSLTWKTLQKAALSTPAPPSFLSWLRRCSTDLMDQVPNTPQWSGSHVTQFIIQEASQNFREELLDLLTEGLEQSESVEQPEVKVQAEGDTGLGGDTDLFFVDTTKDENTAVQMGRDEVDHSGKETQLLGQIHSLLGGINVGQDVIPEEKEGSEDSDVEEVEFQVPKSKAKRKEEVAEIVAHSLQTYRKHSVRSRAQEERDSTSGPWAIKSPVSPLQGRAARAAARAAQKDSMDSTEEQAVNVENSKLGGSEDSMSATVGESVSEQEMEVVKITSHDKGGDEKVVKHGNIQKSVEKPQKKGKKGKKKSKKGSKEGGGKEHDKLERSFEDIKCLEGESYDSSQESVEMMAFKATASELLQDVEKFMNTTKEGEQELQVDINKEGSKTDTSEGIKEVSSAENVENKENCQEAEITLSEESQVKKGTESAVVECDADSGKQSDADDEEGFQSQGISHNEGSPTVEEQGLVDVQDGSVPDSQSFSDDSVTPSILKLHHKLGTEAKPNLDQSDIVPLVVEANGSNTGEEVEQELDEEVVAEAPTANITEMGETQMESIFKTPLSPARGKSSPARANLSPSKPSPVKTTRLVSSPATRRRRLSTDEELHELAAEVTEKIAEENSEDDVKSLAPGTPPSKASDKRRRSTLGQSYGKYIEKQTFPDVITEGADTGGKVSDQTEKSEAPADGTLTSQESPEEHPTSKDLDTSKVDESLSETDEDEESSKTVTSSGKSAEETKEREPTPMVKRERRKTSQQQTLQPVGEEPSSEVAPDSSDSSLSSNNRRKSLRRRKLELNNKQEAEQSSKKELETQSEKSEETVAQSEESELDTEDKGSQETSTSTTDVTPNTETAVVERGEEEADVAMAQSSDMSSEQLTKSAGKKQSKVLRMVKSSPTPKRNKGEEDRIKLVSPQGSPELQFSTSGAIMVRVSSDSPDHKPVVVQSPNGELIIKAYNPKVVVAPDLTGNAKRLDFEGTADKDKGQPAEGTGSKRDASSAGLDVPKGRMVLRTRSKSPIPSDSSSLTSVSSMSDSGTRRKSRRSLRKLEMEPVVQEEDNDDDKQKPIDTTLPSTSGTRSRRSKVPRVMLEDIGSQHTDSDLSVSSQSSSSRRRSKAVGIASDLDVSDSQATRRSTRKRATGRDKESPPKKVKTTDDGEEDVEKMKKEMESGPELIVLDSSQENPPEAGGDNKPATRSRVKRESESTTVSEVWSDVDMFSLSPPHTRRGNRLKAVHETLSNASSMSDMSAVDSEQEGSISARTRSSRKRRSEHAGKLARSAVMTEMEAKKRLSML